MPRQAPTMRTRSAIACVRCHERKVRCNAASQGIPCSNCLQDRLSCQIYGRKALILQSRSRLQPRPLEVQTEHVDLPTPSTAATDNPSQDDSPGLSTLNEESSHSASSGHFHQPQSPAPNSSRRGHEELPCTEEASDPYVPFYAGESEGLEFVFDVCAPSRTVRGPHYAVKREYHKRLFSRYELSQEQVLWPEPAVRDELVRLFFHYVHPFLPVVDPHDFLHKYGQGVNSISRLLLWSIFFAAANFASVDLLRQAQFQSRKTLREYFYQRAKELYDGQDEGEKTTIIQSAILLSFWYVDREEIDGAWHWLGIALSLCHTLGLHRAWSNDAFAQTPFTHSFRTTWKRIWWCCFYREAFAAQGFGRPMRIHIDDCDIDMPTINDVSLSYENLAPELVEKYLPQKREYLAHLWLDLLQLATHLESILALHYRPRRPHLSLSEIDADNANLRSLRDELASPSNHGRDVSLLHLLHLQSYVNLVIIVLHRPYVLQSPEHLPAVEQDYLRGTARKRVKEAASNLTALSSKLIALDWIDMSFSMLVTTTMTAAQIHLFEIKTSEGLARQFARNHYNLHVLILAQLQRTYWTADYQHQLFTETIKAVEEIEKGQKQLEAATTAAKDINRRESSTTAAISDQISGNTTSGTSVLPLNPDEVAEAGLEELFLSFNPNPFLSLPLDPSTTMPDVWGYSFDP